MPLVVASGAPFPARAEIIFLAFIIILVTLVGQGLTLPVLIRRLGVTGDGGEEQEEALARLSAARAALSRLDELSNDPEFSPDLVDAYRQRYEREAAALQSSQGTDSDTLTAPDGKQRLQRALLHSEREALLQLRNEGAISDQVLRRVQRDLDLEEARLGA